MKRFSETTRLYLAEDRDVVNAVVVGEWLNEAIAETRFSDADRSLLLFAAGQSNDCDRKHPGRTGTGRRVATTKSQA